MSMYALPPNEPGTDFTDPEVRGKLQEALSRVNGTVEDIPIVIGGQEFRTSDVKYQVCVSTQKAVILNYAICLYS